MTSGDVYCLQCGYDLRAIPQQRCPECGFGYDHAAVRYFALRQNWDRHDAVRRVVASVALALAILVSPLTWTFTLGPTGRVALIYAAWLTAILVGRFMENRDPEGSLLSASPDELFLRILRLAPLPAMFIAFSPILALIAATVICLRSWYILARAPEHFSHAYLMQPEQRQYNLHVYTAFAIGGLVVVTIIVLVAWFS